MWEMRAGWKGEGQKGGGINAVDSCAGVTEGQAQEVKVTLSSAETLNQLKHNPLKTAGWSNFPSSSLLF